MAAGGLLALLDDITTLLDDVAILSKAAATKTAGITGDDLAVNSQALVGIDPKRELPIVWAVAKGSFINKCFLIPGALLLNWAAPFLIQPLLMMGGLYLCFEGVEKVIHSFQKEDKKHHKGLIAAAKTQKSLEKFEEDKIKGAIRTDVILSAEIIVITLGTVTSSPFMQQVAVLTTIGVGITVVIYGLVGGLIKLDDLGFYLSKKKAMLSRIAGRVLVEAAPKILKLLGVVGTAAMFLVGGELIIHGIPPLTRLIHHILDMPAGWLFEISEMLAAVVVGILAGLLAIPVVNKTSLFYKKHIKKPNFNR